MSSLILERGDVCMVQLVGIGSMQNGYRPCIVLSSNDCNESSPTITIIPLTTQKKTNLPTHTKINKSSGIAKTSTALAECITTIDKSMVKKIVGKCSEIDMRKIAKSVLHHCGIRTISDIIQ